MSTAQREVLERVSRSTSAPHREVVRAKVLLDAADGVGSKTIASRHDVTAVTVRAWRTAFTEKGLTGWGKVKKGRGRKPTITDEQVAEIVRLTTQDEAEGPYPLVLPDDGGPGRGQPGHGATDLVTTSA